MRTVLFVIDGLGVGSTDTTHNTLRSVLTAEPDRRYPTLQGMGLLNHPTRIAPTCVAPDSYLGHLEMINAAVQPQLRILDDLRPQLHAALTDHTVTTTDTGVIVVDDTIAVYDNLDADPGLSLCVLGSRDQTPAATVSEVAATIRAVIDLPRVIAASGDRSVYDDTDTMTPQRRRSTMLPASGMLIDCYDLLSSGAALLFLQRHFRITKRRKLEPVRPHTIRVR